jgi:hypothetical protein
MLGIGWRASTPIDGEVLAEYEAAYTRPASVAAMLGYYRAATRPRLAAAVRRARVPGRPRVKAERMLVLWGAQDPVLPVSTGEGVVKDLGSECVMVTVPGAGHFVIEEAPDVVAEVLADFLAEGTPLSVAPPEGPEQPRVAEAEPPSGDLGDAPSVGPVPVGGSTSGSRRATAKKSPAAKKASAAKKAPATKQAPAATATSPPATKATKAPAAKKASGAGPRTAAHRRAQKPPSTGA